MPRDVLALSRLFPVMLQVEAVAASPPQEHEIRRSVRPAPPRVRGAARTARPRSRIAIRVVFYIDDLHWADADSAVLLEELLRPPGSPPLLTLLCFRSEETAAKPFLQALLERSGTEGCVTLSLGPMEDEEAHELIESLIPSESAVSRADRLRIAREAGGNPFCLEQLARYVARRRRRDRINRRRSRTCSARGCARCPRRRGTSSTRWPFAGVRWRRNWSHEACGLSGDERPLVASLRSAHFLRSSGSAERVELYHDRIRQTLAAQVSPDDARRIHRAMADTLVAQARRRSGGALRTLQRRRRSRAGVDPGRARGQRRPMPRWRSIGPASSIAARWSSRQRAPDALVEDGAGDARSRMPDARPTPRTSISTRPPAPDPRAADRAAAARRGTIPDRRPHRPGARRDSHGARRRRDAPGARAARARSRRWCGGARSFAGADWISSSAPTDRVSAGRSPSHRHLLVGRDRARDGGQHSRGRFPDAATCMLALDAGEPFRIARALAIESGFRASGNGPRRQGSAPFARSGPGPWPRRSVIPMPSRCPR